LGRQENKENAVCSSTSLENGDASLRFEQTTSFAYSVIICTLNRAPFVDRCLRAALREADSVAYRGEIILVDNGSTDDTRAVFQRYATNRQDGRVRLRYLFEVKPSLSVARNRGIKEAYGDILIFLDDDAIPQAGWLECCLTAFDRNPALTAAGGEILPMMTIPAPEWFRPPLTRVYTVTNLAGIHMRPFPARDHPLGANMAFRKSVFDKRCFSEHLGRSDANLMSGEEKQIFALIRREGGEILYVPGMRVTHFIHPERLTDSWVLTRYYFEGVSLASLDLGWKAQSAAAFEMGIKIVVLLLTRPFVRSSFHRLLWQCRLRKSTGYFFTLIHRDRHPPP
jgi:glycosyltransferase involved in cell wall biosynthesis